MIVGKEVEDEWGGETGGARGSSGSSKDVGRNISSPGEDVEDVLRNASPRAKKRKTGEGAGRGAVDE